MSILSWFKKKKEDGGRVSSIERYETSSSMPMHFWTEYGGSAPLFYQVDTPISELAATEPLRLLEEAIAAGVIDEYSDLSIFFSIADEYYRQSANELKKQTISRKDVGEKLIMQAGQGRCLREAETDKLKAILKALAERVEAEDCLTKGVGDLL